MKPPQKRGSKAMTDSKVKFKKLSQGDLLPAFSGLDLGQKKLGTATKVKANRPSLYDLDRFSVKQRVEERKDDSDDDSDWEPDQ